MGQLAGSHKDEGCTLSADCQRTINESYFVHANYNKPVRKEYGGVT